MESFFTDEEYLDCFDTLSREGYVIIDNYYSREIYSTTKNFLFAKLEEDSFKKAGVGAQTDHRIIASARGDFVYWLNRDRDNQLEPFFLMVEELRMKLNKMCYLSLSGYEFHLAYYPRGTHYERHVDQFKDRNNRLVSLVIYLNEDWQEGDGGELVIYGKNKSIRVEPLAGRCVLFKSDSTEHEVLFTNTDRYSLTGWFLYYPQGIGGIMG